MVVMDFPSDSGESVRQRIVASARVMGHRRIPVIPGQLSPPSPPYRHQRRVAAHNRAARTALTTPTRKRSNRRTTPAATYPVISLRALEAGDERRYR